MIVDSQKRVMETHQTEIAEHLVQGHLALAVEACQQALVTRPSDVQTAIRLALLSFHHRNRAEVLAAIDLTGGMGVRTANITGLDRQTGFSIAENAQGFCMWPWMGLYVPVDGRALPCCHLTDTQRSSLCDLRSQNVEETWNNRAFHALCQRILDSSPLANRCLSRPYCCG
jgi:MoaA/NifB/PqqE/SkfB family radical SAM enzyme